MDMPGSEQMEIRDICLPLRETGGIFMYLYKL